MKIRTIKKKERKEGGREKKRWKMKENDSKCKCVISSSEIKTLTSTYM